LTSLKALALEQARALARARRRAGGLAAVVLDAARSTNSPSWRKAPQRPLRAWIIPRPLSVVCQA